MTKPDRIACLVPFCRRTLRNDGGFAEWICGKHWAAVRKVTKRRRRIAERAARRASERFDTLYMEQGGVYEPQFQRVMAAKRLSAALWDRCKTEAIERAAGI